MNKVYGKRENTPLNLDIQCQKQWDLTLDLYMDIDEVVQTMKQARPLLYQPYYLYYMEGRKISEISKIMEISCDAIKRRLYSARLWLAENLKDYGE